MSSPSAPATQIQVTPVETKKDLDAFIRLPWRIYQGNKYWVPPLLLTERQRFTPKHNPFYEHADIQLFLARREGEVVGRIAAYVDHLYNDYQNERSGFFGFLECLDDADIAGALLRTAEDWLRERGMERVLGPLNFFKAEVGFLMWGFDRRPQYLMPYTHEYYLGLMESCGYVKVRDVYAWRWERQPVPDGPPRRMAEELRSRPEVTIRRARMSDFDAEVARMLDMYNDAWSDLWGHVPATDAEAKQLASDLRLVVDTGIVPVVEVDGVPAGMALALPNINWAIRPLNGKLLPFGWLRLLWRLKVRRPKSGRLLLLGIKKEFRSRKYAGLAYLLCDEIYRGALERNFRWAEFGWTLEDNGLINSLIKKVGAEHYKSYRIYEKALT